MWRALAFALSALPALFASLAPAAASGRDGLAMPAPLLPTQLRFSAQTPPASRADDGVRLAAVPQVLSATDRALYARIFALQEDGDWQNADTLVRELSNRLLMGHVLFQRYMHPSAYRSRYSELKNWLKAYRDHPGARRIYALAKRRQGRAAAPPRPMGYRQIVGLGERPAKARQVPPRSRDERRDVRDFERRVRYEVRRRRPERAEKRYWAIERRNLLAPFEAADALGDIAAAYFFTGDDAKARALAQIAAELSPGDAGDAYWFGGLAAWRLGDCQAAHDLFAPLSGDESGNEWVRSAGGFWAARAALHCGRPEDVTAHLLGAAADSETFYGLIAARQLALAPPHDWRTPALTAGRLAKIADLPAVRRAVALTEAGRHYLADEEMRLTLGRVDRALLPALTALSVELKLPASQLRLARALPDADMPASMRYPVPQWAPDGGFAIDRAVLFAFIRQESEFMTRARSYAGATGLMQLMPATASYMAGDRSLRWKKSRLYEPGFNMALGQRYIGYLADLSVVEGNLFMVAAGYNAGPGNLSKWRRRHDYQNDPLLFVETLPARETRNYIERVMANLWLYRMQLGQQTPSLDAVAAGAWPVYEQLDSPTLNLAAGPANPSRRMALHAGN